MANLTHKHVITSTNILRQNQSYVKVKFLVYGTIQFTVTVTLEFINVL